MKKRYYTPRQYRVAAGFVLALSAPAIAQVPPLNLPGLPPPPGVTNPATGSTAATAPLPLPIPTPKSDAEERREAARKGIPINPADMLPPEMLKQAGVEPEQTPPSTDTADKAPETDTDKDADTKKTADADSDDTDSTQTTEDENNPNDAVKTADGTAAKPATPANTAEDAPPAPPAPFGSVQGVPPLALPGNNTSVPVTLPTGTQPFGPFLPSDDTKTAGLNEDGTPLKSWQKPLAPARTYPTTKFNYRRVMLPASVYRTSYNPQNRHLPTRRTMEDLDKAFLIAVAKNDINGTRALLNSGRNVNQMNAYGDSALIVAVRAGAFDTARLLLARGANPNFYGSGGKTAFFYARQHGNNDFAKLLLKGA